LDTFGSSLVHVNRLYHAAFGREQRKVPAHMPHMIDKDIMQEMQQRWKTGTTQQ
jgi:UDP-N-acetylglucosamine-lysosomal-enzyme